MKWSDIIVNQKEEEYFKILQMFLKNQRSEFEIYPPEDMVYNAFKLTPFESIKVVILGQDPYHGQGQAHGLSFSVQSGIKTPPSLTNIFKEIKSELGIVCEHADLTKWCNQGVLLLNSVLTVRKGEPASHQNKGWEIFTDYIISEISDKREGIVFLLWGKFAQSKEYIINKEKHFVLKCSHPSPYSANSGFFGCGHFTKTNEILESIGKSKINWST